MGGEDVCWPGHRAQAREGKTKEDLDKRLVLTGYGRRGEIENTAGFSVRQ